MSRIITVTTPDTAFVTTSYSGNSVTVEDQHDPNDPDVSKRVGRKRRSYTDALGRLTQVTEDPSGAAYQTYYTYDVLNNLVKVNQGSQNRYFLYDSLSRLVRARNPEQDVNGGLATSAAGTYSGLGNSQWTIGYVYDANGNLTSKTDARNVTTNYGYDALNRNIWANYNDGYTPVIERHYDGPIGNGKGRLHYHLSYNSHPVTSAAAYSYMVVNSYDAVGRPLSGSQQLLNSGGTWTAYAMSRTYDLAGNALTQTYPSNRQITNSYNAGGRLSSFTGALGDGASRIYADTFSYNPAGQMTKERFGTGINLYHNLHYNNRLQLVDIRLGNSSSDEWNWNRGALIFYYSNQARGIGNPFLDAKDNNGNVMMSEHYVPTDDPISSYAITLRDTYEYDALNRLTQTNGVQRNTAGSWFAIYGQWYNYDQYGNRTINNGATWGNAINNAVYSISAASNRVNGMSYDAAGNVINDNGNAREYDGENRMKKAWGGSNWNYYLYDADGKRVRRIVGTTQEYWQVYGFDGELIAEYPVNGAAGSPQKEYGYRGGQLMIVAEGSNVKWLMSDQLGTPRMVVDKSGRLTDDTSTTTIFEGVIRHDYLPFGEELLPGMGNGSIRSASNGYPGDNIRQKFGSKERDTETGLDYFGARYLSSVQGRFVSPDPLEFWMLDEKKQPEYIANPQRWNKYAYVLNNPLRYVDPTGLAEVPVWEKLDKTLREDLTKRGVTKADWNKWNNDQRQEVLNNRAILMEAGVWGNVTSITFGTFTVVDNWGTANDKTNFTPSTSGWALAITTDKDIQADFSKGRFQV